MPVAARRWGRLDTAESKEDVGSLLVDAALKEEEGRVDSSGRKPLLLLVGAAEEVSPSLALVACASDAALASMDACGPAMGDGWECRVSTGCGLRLPRIRGGPRRGFVGVAVVFPRCSGEGNLFKNCKQ